jgi:hypothetical protein
LIHHFCLIDLVLVFRRILLIFNNDQAWQQPKWLNDFDFAVLILNYASFLHLEYRGELFKLIELYPKKFILRPAHCLRIFISDEPAVILAACPPHHFVMPLLEFLIGHCLGVRLELMLDDLLLPPDAQTLDGYVALGQGLPGALPPDVSLADQIQVRHQIQIDLVVVEGPEFPEEPRLVRDVNIVHDVVAGHISPGTVAPRVVFVARAEIILCFVLARAAIILAKARIRVKTFRLEFKVIFILILHLMIFIMRQHLATMVEPVMIAFKNKFISFYPVVLLIPKYGKWVSETRLSLEMKDEWAVSFNRAISDM